MTSSYLDCQDFINIRQIVWTPMFTLHMPSATECTV